MVHTSTLIFGPLNHFRAEMNHQAVTKSMLSPFISTSTIDQAAWETYGPKYTTTVQFIPSASRFSPLTDGKQRMGSITRMNAQPATPIGLLNLPKCHGPRRNRSPTKKVLMKIGTVKATIAEMAPTLKIAPIAIAPPKIRRRRTIPTATLNHTALTGV